MSKIGTNPYENLPPQAFWKPSVSSRHMLDIAGLWEPKFKILPEQSFVTYGSCFAQHIGISLMSRGFNVITEIPPYGLSEKNIKLFNYNVFSSRTGNIYTTSLLKQWVGWALNQSAVPDEVWEKDGRFYDPFRPRIEPNGFKSKEEVKLSRKETIKTFRSGIVAAQYFVFTLGLTESWINKSGRYEYPMCPGTVAGEFDPEVHKFENQQFLQVYENIIHAIRLIRDINQEIKFILTVSPVPLTATKSDNHVLVATMESKSILRAVAGQLAANLSYVDYFPSYEIINSPAFKGAFFEPNMRSVSRHGVGFVMDSFFQCLENKFGYGYAKIKNETPSEEDVCEEELLEAFGVSP
jgi:hypothetical protein